MCSQPREGVAYFPERPLVRSRRLRCLFRVCILEHSGATLATLGKRALHTYSLVDGDVELVR
jgi:hypothetical protein